MRRPWGGLVGILAGLVLAGPAAAHNLDTSYCRFKVAKDGIETKFTLDIVSLVRILPGLDANGDKQLTPAELTAAAPAVFSYLRSHVKFEVDGQAADFGELQPVAFPPGVGDAIPEADYHAKTSLVHFTFQKPLAKPPGDFWVLFDFFGDLGERHTVLGAIEHNGDEQEVIFRYFEPDYLFDTGWATPPVPMPSADPATAVVPAEALPPESNSAAHREGRSNTNATLWGQLGSFFMLGVEHIFLGYDHILFLLSLIVVCRFGELLKIVTSFTVAHTITLILATLEVVSLDSRLVETSIAATIVFVALENFWIQPSSPDKQTSWFADTRHRWVLTFCFGLIHGFGFAGVLRELGLPTVGLVRSLVAFNLGVEAGQLAIVAVLFPVAYAISRWKYGRIVQLALSSAIALCGLGWFISRAFGLDFMPF